VLEKLKNGTKVVGAKQTKRAIRDGRAAEIYYAADADPALWEPIVLLCEQEGIPTVEAEGMKELGQACSIAVGAAVAALVKE